MVSPRRLRLHRGTRLESESDTGDADMDVDVDGPHTAVLPAGSGDEDEDGEGTEDGEGEEYEDELESEKGVPSTAATASSAPSRLKITLKMPISSRTETPLIESEDDDEELASEDEELDSEDEEDHPKTKHPLTSRQAALASVLDPSHVSLDSVRGRGRGRGRGRLIGEAEMRLRKEETARKRKNFVEKKLEDEKAETINRLLKKQSRPRGKRAKDAVATPAADADSDEAMDDDTPPNEREPPPPPPPPTMYRWISTSRVPSSSSPSSPTATSTEPRMSITFSIPPSLVPLPSTEAQDVERASGHTPQETDRPPRLTSCAVQGCGRPFRYRLVKDWTRGACGMECLKVLEGRLAA